MCVFDISKPWRIGPDELPQLLQPPEFLNDKKHEILVVYLIG